MIRPAVRAARQAFASHPLLSSILFYLAWFGVFNSKAVMNARTLLLADDGDGLQNVWNLWWFRKAIVELHQSPFYTTYLHFPSGTSLIAHTLNPFNGLIALPFLHFLSLAQIYNGILVFSFVATGVAGFFLARELGGRIGGSLLAGFIITFCSFHFAHAQGHLQLVAFEGVPLFLWLWIRLLETPAFGRAVLAAAALLAVLACDYYYFMACIVAGAVFVASIRPVEREGGKSRRAPLILFGALAAASAGPWIVSLWRVTRDGPLSGTHPPLTFSMDALAPFVPGGHWIFASWTKSIWSRWSGNIQESSVYFGWTVLFWFACGCVPEAARYLRYRRIWLALFALFFVLALGPRLHVAGRLSVGMPYGALARWVPFLQIGGCPVRLVSLAIVAAAMVAGAGFSYWASRPGTPPMAIVLLLALLVFEYWPAPLPMTALSTPGYVAALRDARAPGGVIDAVSSPAWMLYYQTIHQKPLGLGYIARVPAPVRAADFQLVELFRQGRFRELVARDHMRYLAIAATPQTHEFLRGFKTIFDDARVLVVDLAS